MGMMNLENPLNGCYGGGGNNLLVDRLIGSAYENVKLVAQHLDEIERVAEFLKFAVPSTSVSGSMINEVVCAAHVVFDVSTAFIQELNLTQNVTSSEVIGTAAPANISLIIIRVIQDATGGHTLTWPTTIHSHGDIDLTAHAISQQMFAKNLDGSWDMVNPMMYPEG